MGELSAQLSCKAEHQRIDSFELWCWRRLVRVPWTARRSNQSILKEISSEYSLEGLILKLKLQYFGHLMWRTDSLEKTMMQGTFERQEKGMTEDEIVGWHHRLDGHEFEQALGIGDGHAAVRHASPGMLQCMRSKGVRHNWATELTESNWYQEHISLEKVVNNCRNRYNGNSIVRMACVTSSSPTEYLRQVPQGLVSPSLMRVTLQVKCEQWSITQPLKWIHLNQF